MRKTTKNKKQGAGNGKLTILNVTEATELLPFLISRMEDKSRTTIKSLLSHRQVSVNRRVITQFNFNLQKGDEVSITWAKVPQITRYKGLQILFEDQYLIVIEKDAGLLSMATEKEKEMTAYSILSEHIKKEDPANRIFIVHRLDRETSGVMLFAKSEKIQEELQKHWNETIEERTYIAVTEGMVEQPNGIIVSYLHESKALIVYSRQNPEAGQKAVTRYKVLKKNNEFSMLKVNPETGRKNQIRVHMKELGHCIIGDKKYGAIKNPIHRLGLHALVLSFVHPVVGEVMRFESVIPGSFRKLFDKQTKKKPD